MAQSISQSALVAVAVMLSACGADSVERSASGDGALDCDEGQVHRDAGIAVSAATEQEVLGAALAEWVDAGAELIELVPDESWAAVNDGRHVAIAYPQRNGDGTWTVHDVRVCGEPDVGPAPLDGSLDCANDVRWGFQGSRDPNSPGHPTPEEAVLEIMQPYQDQHGGELVFIDDNTGSLVVDDREQVVARADAISAGGWFVSGVSGCEGYNP